MKQHQPLKETTVHEPRNIGQGWWEKFDPNTGRLFYISTIGKATVWDWPEEVLRDE